MSEYLAGTSWGATLTRRHFCGGYLVSWAGLTHHNVMTLHLGLLLGQLLTLEFQPGKGNQY